MSPLIIIVGLLGLLLIAGAAMSLVLGGGQRDVDERMQQFVATSTTVVDIPEQSDEKERGPDMASRMDKALSGRNFFEPLRDKISKADAKLRVSEYIVLVVLASVGGAAAGYFFSKDGSMLLPIIGFVVGSRIPAMYINSAAKKRMQTFDGQLSDTLNLWVNALRSGYSVLQAMEAIATELPAPVSVEFGRVVQEVRLGLSVGQALENMYRRVPSEDLDLVITAVNIQREVGGNLAEVLDSISFTIRERIRIKGEIRTLTAQGRISGTVISLLPVILAGILYLINPDYVSELWVREAPWIWPETIPCGYAVIAVALMMIVFGWLAIRKIVDIEV